MFFSFRAQPVETSLLPDTISVQFVIGAMTNSHRMIRVSSRTVGIYYGDKIKNNTRHVSNVTTYCH